MRYLPNAVISIPYIKTMLGGQGHLLSTEYVYKPTMEGIYFLLSKFTNQLDIRRNNYTSGTCIWLICTGTYWIVSTLGCQVATLCLGTGTLGYLRQLWLLPGQNFTSLSRATGTPKSVPYTTPSMPKTLFWSVA